MPSNPSKSAGRQALERIDDAVASFEPVSDTGIHRPPTLLDMGDLLGDLAERSEAFLRKRMRPIYTTVWSGGGPGSSNSEAISTLVLPSGWRAYVSETLNLYWDCGTGRFVLAATDSPDDHAADLAFLHILFTDSDKLHRRFMPNCTEMASSLTLDEVTDLFIESGFDPDEYHDDYEDEYDDEGDEGDEGDDNDDVDDDREEGDTDDARADADEPSVPEWAADLYVFPETSA